MSRLGRRPVPTSGADDFDLETLLRMVAEKLRPQMPVGRTFRFIAADVDDERGRAWEFLIAVLGQGIISLPPTERPTIPILTAPVPLDDDEVTVLLALQSGPLPGKGIFNRLRQMGQPKNFPDLRSLLSLMRNGRGLLNWSSSRGYHASSLRT